jgi:heme exporter protein B
MNRSSHLVMLRWLIWREVVLSWRRKTDIVSTLGFFAIVVSLFPLAIDPEPQLLRTIAPGVIWVSALLASTLGLGRLFAADYADGSLEQMMITPQPLVLIVAGKVLGQWLLTGMPLVLISPFLGIQFGLPAESTWILSATLLTGVPVLILTGGIGAALTLGLRGGGALIALIVLPLSIPVLVFGAGGNVGLTASVLALTVVFAPWAAASALRVSVE